MLPPELDHLIYACPDLEKGMDHMERLLGVRPVIGGRHPDLGTHNALLSLGPGMYLEIMAPNPGLPSPERGRLTDFWRIGTGRLATWILRRADPALVAAAIPVDMGSIRSGSRQNPSGEVLQWTLTDPYADRLGGVLPFLINWGTTPHPSLSLPVAGRLKSLSITHPNPDAVRAALTALGEEVPVQQGTDPGLQARITTPRGTVLLS